MGSLSKTRRCRSSSDEDSGEDDKDTDDDNTYVSDINVGHILQAPENDDIDKTG